VRISFEGTVEQAADESGHFRPISVGIGLLERCVILVQQNEKSDLLGSPL
jgi:hypothetical protein